MTKPDDQVTAVGCGRHAMGDCGCTPGLTKREYFAAKALQGLLANEQGFDQSEEKLAHYAVSQADALIAELNKKAEVPT